MLSFRVRLSESRLTRSRAAIPTRVRYQMTPERRACMVLKKKKKVRP